MQLALSDVDKDLVRAPGMGRITGSASIETLVRVGIEKENGLAPDSKMVVLHDFTPCVDDELEVKRGQVVNILYRENDWVYVIAADSRQEGFIPHSYCTPYNSHLGELALSNVKKKLPREQRNGSLNPNATIGAGEDPSGRYIVLYTFIARDENDVSVERGEFVTVLNREDPDWYWIVRSDGQEGFVPSGFVYPAHVIQDIMEQNWSCCTTTRRGDWIYADLNNQTVDGWLWAYAPKTRKYGFIPKAYARPPAMTSL
uniref:SH3 domain-containing protein n=1 Tax=Timema genevievae TaxID=629358 RepID=A0A7R9K6M1_TIMGE|nr:unnamed protein product [Timema genevievae]